MLDWQCKSFAQLSNDELYELIKLRIDVFVVEQNCPYAELDNKDRIPGVKHLLGYQGKEIVACARLLPAGVSFVSPSIGRVITKASSRGTGFGHELIQQAQQHCQKLWPQELITIGAQAHLEKFYARHGFKTISAPYLEDDILHIDMQYCPTTA